MRRKALTGMLLICAAILFLGAFTSTVSASTLYVPDDYSTIQAAVSAASPRDTIVVRDGAYTENINVDKALTIKSENGPESTIVRSASPNNHLFNVTADHVTITGFTITGASGLTRTWEISYIPAAGICLNGASCCNISNNEITHNSFGICAFMSPYFSKIQTMVNDTSISNNNISHNEVGIKGTGYNSTVINNNISYNGDGIDISHAGSTVINNIIKSNRREGLIAGGNNTVANNIVSNNSIGIKTTGAGSIIINNDVNSNIKCGIQIESNNNTITQNNVHSNKGGGIYVYGYNDAVYLNNFINNKNNAGPAAIWNSTEKISYAYNGKTYKNYLGNYWSDYTGKDINGDGVGDIPHYAVGNDNYPLLKRFDFYVESIYPPAVTPTLTLTPMTHMPTEDAFYYQGEYKLDRNKLRPEESKALPFVMKYAKEYKVSPCIIMAVIRQESNFDASANGGTDVGYMQVTHDAAKDGGYKGTEQEWRQKDGPDPDQNIEYGTKYLKALNSIFRDGKLLTKDLKATKVPDKTERLKFVLAAYNGGQGRIAKAQQICVDKGDNPERWNDVKKYLEAAGETPEKAKIIRNYVEQVIEGRDLIDGQRRGYEFLLTTRVPVSETPTPEEGVPGFEAVFAIAGLLALAYVLGRWK